MLQLHLVVKKNNTPMDSFEARVKWILLFLLTSEERSVRYVTHHIYKSNEEETQDANKR